MFRELVAQHRFFRLRLDGERGGTRRSADARRRSGCLEKEGTRNTRCVEKGRTRTYLELEQPGEQVPAELAQRLLLNLQTREHVLRGWGPRMPRVLRPCPQVACRRRVREWSGARVKFRQKLLLKTNHVLRANRQKLSRKKYFC